MIVSKKLLSRYDNFRLVNIFMSEKHLAIEVVHIDNIFVNQYQFSNSHSR